MIPIYENMKTEMAFVIKSCRKHCQLKQDYVAFKLGITTSAYANIENGRAELKTSKLFTLAVLFGLKPHQMLTLTEEIIDFGEYNWLPNVLKQMIRRSD